MDSINWLAFTSLLEPISRLWHDVEKETRAKPCSAGRGAGDPPNCYVQKPLFGWRVREKICSFIIYSVRVAACIRSTSFMSRSVIALLQANSFAPFV